MATVNDEWGVDISVVHDESNVYFGSRLLNKEVIKYVRVALLRGKNEMMVFHAVKQPEPEEGCIPGEILFYKEMPPGENPHPFLQLIEDAEVGRKIRKKNR